MEISERVARAEQRIDTHDNEIGRLRDVETQNSRDIASNSAALGRLSEEVRHILSNTEMIAERAATRAVGAAFTAFATDRDAKAAQAAVATDARKAQENASNMLKYALRAVIVLAVLAAVLAGIKAGGLLP